MTEMAYLVRKFNRPKWEPNSAIPNSINDLPADALTSCLRTSGNTLSVWEADEPVWGEFDDVLAALFSSLDGPSRSDIILLEKEAINSVDGVELIHNEGVTPADPSTNRKHRDIAKLKHSSISALASIILNELEQKESSLVKRYREKEVIDIVKRFLEEEKIDKDKLSDRWLIKLGLKSAK